MNKQRSMVISLIGRPNVGKSSLFNRLMNKQNKALTYDKPGVTRDRHYGIAKFDENHDQEAVESILVDTGGFYPSRIDERGATQEEANFNKFFNIMTEQAQMAIAESDLVLFVVDVREGVLPFDEVIANYIREQKKPFWLLVNKYDSDKQMGEEAQFYSLGMDPDEMFVISASHGRGVPTLKEKLQTQITNWSKEENIEDESSLQQGVAPREFVVSKVALIGAPNAGKSTLLNNILGANRALVSDIAGTTVDPIEGYFDLYFGKMATLLSEKSKDYRSDNLLFEQYEAFRKNNPEFYSSMVSAYQTEEEAHGELTNEELVFDEESALLYEAKKMEEIQDKLFNEEESQIISEVVEAKEDIKEEKKVDLESEMHSLKFEDIKNNKEDMKNGSYWRSVHLIDTAGIRKQRAQKGHIEEQSVYRSLRSITESDIVVYMIDATMGIGHQDQRLMGIALDKGKSVIICLNKMDIVREQFKNKQDQKEWLANMKDQIPWLTYCDVIPMSAKFDNKMDTLKNTLKKTILVRRRKIGTGDLNRQIFNLVEQHPIAPKGSGGKRFKVKYASMIKSNPPTFMFFTNKSKAIPESYKRYLKNGLRAQFDFDNTPIHLIFRTGSDLAKRMKKVEIIEHFK